MKYRDAVGPNSFGPWVELPRRANEFAPTNAKARAQMEFCNCPAWSGAKCDVAQYVMRVTAIPAARVVRQRPKGFTGGYTHG